MPIPAAESNSNAAKHGRNIETVAGCRDLAGRTGTCSRGTAAIFSADQRSKNGAIAITGVTG